MFFRKRQEKGPLHLSEPFSSISFGPGQQTSPPWIIAPLPSDQPCGSFLPVPAETSSMTLYRFSSSLCASSYLMTCCFCQFTQRSLQRNGTEGVSPQYHFLSLWLYSGLLAPQPAQKLPPLPVWPQFGQVRSPSFRGLGDPHSGQNRPVFPAALHFGQVQASGAGAAFGG